MNAVPQSRHWPARLALQYTGGPRTIISERRHSGPLTIQRPFYPEGDTCHTYLLHPPGGVAAGDDLHLSLKLQDNAHALVTTPASGKFYRSNGPFAQLNQEFDVQEGSLLEWLPQENIYFPGSRVRQTSRITLPGQARLVFWEITCFGRPACQEAWDQGVLDQRIEIHRAGQPLFLERTFYKGDEALMGAAWGLAGYPVTAVMLVSPVERADLDACRAQLHTQHGLAAATLMDDLLVIRYLGAKVEEARQCFQRVWRQLRPGLTGKPACEPRIWHT